MNELNEHNFTSLTEYKSYTKYYLNNKLSEMVYYDDECRCSLYSAYMTKKDIKMFHCTKYGCVTVYKGLRLFEYKKFRFDKIGTFFCCVIILFPADALFCILCAMFRFEHRCIAESWLGTHDQATPE